LQVLHLAHKYLPQPRSDGPVNAFPTFVAVVAPAFLLLIWKVLSIIFRVQIHGIKVSKELFSLKTRSIGFDLEPGWMKANYQEWLLKQCESLVLKVIEK
jgi:hypothetical protein